MKNRAEIASAVLIRTAKADARRDVSKWRWRTFGIGLCIVSVINIVLLGIAILFVYLKIPTINLSSPERVNVYSQHPALYTKYYRKTLKTLRTLNIFCGWIIGIIIILFLSLL